MSRDAAARRRAGAPAALSRASRSSGSSAITSTSTKNRSTGRPEARQLAHRVADSRASRSAACDRRQPRLELARAARSRPARRNALAQVARARTVRSSFSSLRDVLDPLEQRRPAARTPASCATSGKRLELRRASSGVRPSASAATARTYSSRRNPRCSSTCCSALVPELDSGSAPRRVRRFERARIARAACVEQRLASRAAR